jgi:hypothetical protein
MLCGKDLAESDVKTMFQHCDVNGGGLVLFDEFFIYFVMDKVTPPDKCITRI